MDKHDKATKNPEFPDTSIWDGNPSPYASVLS